MRVNGWGCTSNKYFILKCSENAFQLKNEKCISEQCLNGTRLWNCQIPWNYGTWKMGTSFYSLLEYIRGDTLHSFLTQKKINEHKLINLLVKIIDLIEKLYERHRFVHWDLAPHNIVVNPKRGPCIIDFGRSRLTLGCGKIIAPSWQFAVPRKNQDASHLLVTTLYHLVRRVDAPNLKICIPWIKSIIFPKVKNTLLIQETQKEAKYDRLLTGKIAKFITAKKKTFSSPSNDQALRRWWAPKLLPLHVQTDALQGKSIIKSLLKYNWPTVEAVETWADVEDSTSSEQLNLNQLCKLYDLWDDNKKWNFLVKGLKEKRDAELDYLLSLR